MNFSSDPINTHENLIYQNKPKSTAIYTVVVFFVVLFLALLPVIKLDISSQARGILRSNTALVPINTLVSGRLAAVNIRANSLVQQGDTLLRFTQDYLQADIATNKALLAQNQAQIRDLKQLLQGKTSLQTPALQQEYYSYASKRSELQSRVAQAKVGFNRNKLLYNNGVIAQIEFEKYSFELLLAQEALQGHQKSQQAQWQNKLLELETQTKNLKGSLNKLAVEAKNYSIIAPVGGTIEGFSGLQAGSFVAAGQNIAMLSPNDKLIVETSVSPSDIGLIHKGQEVKLQLDAFNYNQWGLLDGKVIEVDQNITLQDNKAFFKVRCSLQKNELQLKNGYKAKLKKGMTLTTRFIIARRSVFDLLFDKVDDWVNPKLMERGN
jgi:membrane fusion protein, peptide pheromone/bacteriocin exporter